MLLIHRVLNKRFPCPVHCRIFGVDRDIVLTESHRGVKFYICESIFEEVFYDNAFCGLVFPASRMSEKEIEEKIKKLAEKKIKELT